MTRLLSTRLYETIYISLTSFLQEETVKLQRQNDMLETRLRNSPPAQAKTPGRGLNKEIEIKARQLVLVSRRLV